MAKLIYSAITSLDGYIEDSAGKFDWAVPDEEMHRFVNDLERAAGTYLYGRRMYETMADWEADPSLAAESPLMRDFAGIWHGSSPLPNEVVTRTHSSGNRTTRWIDGPPNTGLHLTRFATLRAQVMPVVR